MNLTEDIPIHDFLVHGDFVYTITNNYVKDDKNKSICKVFKIEGGL